MKIQDIDTAAAANARAPRVSLEDIRDNIREQYYVTGSQAVEAIAPRPLPSQHPLAILTICILVLKNGFTVIGKSAPASPENYNRDLGKKFAYEDAVGKVWPLMGYALREKLAELPNP